jgi:hypothetical protein
MLAGVGAFPPFLEDICILLPRMQVFTLLETFLPMFKTLQEAGVVSVNDTLTGFKLLNEDKLTLGYVVC